MRSLRRALLWASVAGLWIGCTVNHAGLTDAGGLPGDGAPATDSGSGGASAGRGGVTGTGGGAGGVFSGAGGIAGGTGNAGGAGVSGSAGAAGSSGAAGDGGSTGAAGSDVTGAAGSAGNTGSAGSAGSTGGTDSSGAAGAAGGGVAGSGGTSGNAGSGGTGTVGRAGSGGGGGRAGNTGRGGRGGTGGNGGRGGTGGNPCASYPQAKAFVTPTDGQVHCYWARSTSQTWSQAQQGCMLQNGHLVTILSAEENDFVVSVAQFSSAFDDTWIGATDDKAGGDRSGPGTYRWVTNEAWGYTSWQQGQPDGFCDPCSMGQTCTCDHRAVLSSDGTWNDRWQDNSRSSVCEAP